MSTTLPLESINNLRRIIVAGKEVLSKYFPGVGAETGKGGRSIKWLGKKTGDWGGGEKCSLSFLILDIF